MSFGSISGISGPHAGAGIVTSGTPIAEAGAAMVLLHGRGSSAEDILALAGELELRGTALIAPNAVGGSWYPYPFLAPLQRNEPYLSSALELLGALVESLEQRGIPRSRQALLGFSQGGCLTLEFSGRFAHHYGAVVGLSAGLIGPPGRSWNFGGSLGGTPVLLGCSDQDPHIPRERVEESAGELGRIGGEVDLQIYPGLGHTVNLDEVSRVQRLMDRLAPRTNHGEGVSR